MAVHPLPFKKQPKPSIPSLLVADYPRMLTSYPSISNQRHPFIFFWWPTIYSCASLTSQKATNNINYFPFGGQHFTAAHPLPFEKQPSATILPPLVAVTPYLLTPPQKATINAYSISFGCQHFSTAHDPTLLPIL